MIIIRKKENCCGCEACLNICPVKCISMEYDEEGFRYPKIDEKKCINCHQCEKICPIINNYCSKNNMGYKAYGATNKNEDILKNSTSGGVFFELGKLIIEKYKGIVFGVKFDGEKNAIFDYASDIGKLKEFMGSKYVQAKVEDTYRKVKEFLGNNRYVLFSGTPCQIAGLYSYLKGKSYDNLYTVDLVCEGVPSERLLNIFKKHYEDKYKSKITDIKFRNKRYGWKYLGFCLTFDNKKKVYIPRTEIGYLNILYGLIYLRPSCYDCKFRELNSGSDFKLADFWEVEKSWNSKYDYYGVSHLLVNNSRAEKLFKEIEDKFWIYQSSVDEIKKLNNSFNSQKFSDEKKIEFHKEIQNKSEEEIYKIMDKNIKLNKIEKIKFRIKLKLVKVKYGIKQRKKTK